MKILIAGELNADLVLQGYQSFPTPGREVLVEDCSLALGSSSAICAAGLAKLGNDVCFVSKLGCDTFGAVCLDALAELGVNCSAILRDPALKTGVTVSISSRQDRALVTYLGSIAALKASDVRDEALRSCRHLHVSSFFLQESLRPDLKALFSRAHGLGLTTSLDPGFDPSQQWGRDLVEVLEEVDIFLPNEVELEAITDLHEPEEALRALSQRRTLVVAKLGASGSMAWQNGRAIRVPAFPVTPVDTTGAGDSFNAGFLHAWLRGKSLEDVMRFAAACGSLSTQGVGGTAAQATESQADELIRKAELLNRK